MKCWEKSNLERYSGFSFILSSVPGRGLTNCLLNKKIRLWSFSTLAWIWGEKDKERRAVLGQALKGKEEGHRNPCLRRKGFVQGLSHEAGDLWNLLFQVLF